MLLEKLITQLQHNATSLQLHKINEFHLKRNKDYILLPVTRFEKPGNSNKKRNGSKIYGTVSDDTTAIKRKSKDFPDDMEASFHRGTLAQFGN